MSIIELYRITGTEKYLTASKNFFELILQYEYNTIFSVGFNDLFLNASKYTVGITELCDVIHFMRFVTELHSVTGDVKYLDFAEKAFYNPFLAGVTRDGKKGSRAVRGIDSHMFETQCGFEYNDCCTNNMPRGFINFAQQIATSAENAVYVNFFSEAKVILHPTKAETVNISIGGTYLQNCVAKIEIDADIDGTKKLMIRIPQWSRKTEIKIGESRFYPDAGKYFETSLNSGKTDITIYFDASPVLCETKHNAMVYPVTPYMQCRYYSDKDTIRDVIPEENKATLCVGAVLLALAKSENDLKENIVDRETVFGQNVCCSVTEKSAEDALCRYEVTFAYPDGKTETLIMRDFATSSDTDKHDDYGYTIYL